MTNRNVWSAGERGSAATSRRPGIRERAAALASFVLRPFRADR